MSQTLDKQLYIAVDSRQPLPEGMKQLKFISQRHYEVTSARHSNVVKDYILSPERYVLE